MASLFSTDTSSLLSPPSAKTPPANSVHPFFTPRRILNRINTPNTANSSSRTHLLSPEESPSRRCKRARIIETTTSSKDASKSSLFAAGSASPTPPPCAKLELVEPRKRMRPSVDQRMFMRSLNGVSTRYAFPPGDWTYEVSNYYSRPEDVHYSAPLSGLPFSTAACNRNSLVAIGDESGMVRLLESAKDDEPGFDEPYISMQIHDNAVFDMSWSPDDHLLATASGDQTCRVFDVMAQKQVLILRRHQNSVKQITFNPYNPYILASSARDGVLNIWDMRVSGPKVLDGDDVITILEPVQTIEAAHSVGRRITSVTSVIWAEEHRIATSGEKNAEIKLWDLKSSNMRRRKSQPIVISGIPGDHSQRNRRDFGINCLSISPDAQRIYAVCKDNNVYAYATHNLAQGPIHAYSHPKLHASTFYVKSDVSRDGRILATGSSDGCSILFPTDEKYLDKRMYDGFLQTDTPLSKEMNVGSGIALVRGHEKEVTDVTWTQDDELVTISDDCQARCWRKGYEGEAESMREGGEEEGRRWMWGWAENN